MLIFHISIALISLIWTGITWFAPSKSKLHLAYGLVAGTVATGTYLVISLHQPLMQSCTTGLIYLSVSFVGIWAGHRKLAREHNN